MINLFLSGNSTAAGSLGGAATATAAPRQVFDARPYLDSGGTLYRCVYVSAGSDYDAIKARISSETTSVKTTITLGWGTAGINGTEQTIANQTTAPAGVTFAAPADFDSAPLGGDLIIDDVLPLWIRLVVNAGAAAVTESFTLDVDDSHEVLGLLEIDGELVELDGELTELA